MLVKGIFTNIAGSTGGVTASHNKGGQYLRARTTPVNPNSPAQQLARSRFTTANEAWSELTPNQRRDWGDFSQLQVWKNKLGDPIQLSGQSAFIGSYSSLLSANLTPVVAPPAPNTRPASYIIAAMTPNIASADVGVMNAYAGGSQRMVIQVSPPIPPGVTSYKGPFQIGGVNTSPDDDAAVSSDIYAAIVAVRGAPVVGQRFAIQFTIVDPLGTYSAKSERVTLATIA